MARCAALRREGPPARPSCLGRLAAALAAASSRRAADRAVSPSPALPLRRSLAVSRDGTIGCHATDRSRRLSRAPPRRARRAASSFASLGVIAQAEDARLLPREQQRRIALLERVVQPLLHRQLGRAPDDGEQVVLEGNLGELFEVQRLALALKNGDGRFEKRHR